MKNFSFIGKDIISIKEFTRQELLFILHVAKTMEKRNNTSSLLKGSIMASCFFEPSTRSRLSFEAALHRLGGSVIGFAEAGVTSASKGESLGDTMKIVSQYADVIVIRHPQDGAARRAAEISGVPVINAGDGSNQHPTQTLLDLYTIQKTQKKIDELHIAFVGDLKYGRTVHSLAGALTQFSVRLYFVAPQSLQIPQELLHQLRSHQIKFSFHERIEEVIKRIDVLYMTRIQKERFTDSVEYSRARDIYQLRPDHLFGTKKNLCVLHPLPRVQEISRAVDELPQAQYFRQAAHGICVRQAVLCLVLGKI